MAKVVCVALEERKSSLSSKVDPRPRFFCLLIRAGTDGGKDEASLLPNLRGRFGAAQLEDANWMSAHSDVMEKEGKLVPGVGKLTFHCFILKNKLLLKRPRPENELVGCPKTVYFNSLALSPQPCSGVHLGVRLRVEKTRQRITSRFHWPGMDNRLLLHLL